MVDQEPPDRQKVIDAALAAYGDGGPPDRWIRAELGRVHEGSETDGPLVLMLGDGTTVEARTDWFPAGWNFVPGEPVGAVREGDDWVAMPMIADVRVDESSGMRTYHVQDGEGNVGRIVAKVSR